MKFFCPICNSPSRDVFGAEPWPAEGGFIEVIQPEGHSSASYSVCSIQCASHLWQKLIQSKPSILLSGAPSKQWKCKQCLAVLPLHPYCGSLKGAECETVPCYCPQIHALRGSGWDYICFCGDACMMEYLQAAAGEKLVAFSA